MNKLPGGYVGLYDPAHQGLIHFYCPCFAAYAKLKEGNEYGRTLHCDNCSINYHEEDRVEYETLWKCRRMSMYPPLPGKKMISDMFSFISGPFSSSKKSNGALLKPASKKKISPQSPGL
jgi:hypothetical protein